MTGKTGRFRPLRRIADAINRADRFLFKNLPICPAFLRSKEFDLLGHNARFYGIGLMVRQRKKVLEPDSKRLESESNP